MKRTIAEVKEDKTNQEDDELPFKRIGPLPSTHDLLEAMATIGCTIVSSARPVFQTIHSSEDVKHQHNETSESMVLRSYAVSCKIQARAANGGYSLRKTNNILSHVAANFNLRHPFLFPWEKDEDRLAGGEWQARRNCYQVIALLFSNALVLSLHPYTFRVTLFTIQPIEI